LCFFFVFRFNCFFACPPLVFPSRTNFAAELSAYACFEGFDIPIGPFARCVPLFLSGTLLCVYTCRDFFSCALLFPWMLAIALSVFSRSWLGNLVQRTGSRVLSATCRLLRCQPFAHFLLSLSFLRYSPIYWARRVRYPGALCPFTPSCRLLVFLILFFLLDSRHPLWPSPAQDSCRGSVWLLRKPLFCESWQGGFF